MESTHTLAKNNNIHHAQTYNLKYLYTRINFSPERKETKDSRHIRREVAVRV